MGIQMSESKQFLLGAMVLGLLLACDNRYINKPIEKHIQGLTSYGGNTISWGKPEVFSASLGKPKTALIPFKPSGGKDIKIGPSDFNYKLSVTVPIEKMVAKKGFTAFHLLKALVQFELMTDSDVVIAKEEVPVTFYLNQTEGSVSAQFTGLSEFDIQKAMFVRVSWVYGRN